MFQDSIREVAGAYRSCVAIADTAGADTRKKEATRSSAVALLKQACNELVSELNVSALAIRSPQRVHFYVRRNFWQNFAGSISKVPHRSRWLRHAPGAEILAEPTISSGKVGLRQPVGSSRAHARSRSIQ